MLTYTLAAALILAALAFSMITLYRTLSLKPQAAYARCPIRQAR